MPPPRALPVEEEPTILGFPADPETGDGVQVVDGVPEVAPAEAAAADVAAAPALVVVRRTDPLGATPLVLAGVAANASLLLSWPPGEGSPGLVLVQRGGEALGAGDAVEALWQPFVVVLCGGLLVVLGFLMMIPARAHRPLGVLALLVSLAAAVALVLLVVDSDLADDGFGPGLWCAAAVPVLGLLGALKAMLTAPLLSLTTPRRRRRSADGSGTV